MNINILVRSALVAMAMSLGFGLSIHAESTCHGSMEGYFDDGFGNVSSVRVQFKMDIVANQATLDTHWIRSNQTLLNEYTGVGTVEQRDGNILVDLLMTHPTNSFPPYKGNIRISGKNGTMQLMGSDGSQISVAGRTHCR